MKATAAVVGSAALLCLVASTAALAQRGGRAGGPAYDPNTAETITGTVQAIERTPRGRGRLAAVDAQVKTDQETVYVHLGPSWYVDKQDVKLDRGDRVEVTGSRLTAGGKAVMIAADVKKGDAVLHLRDATGVPRWSGRGGRRPPSDTATP